MAITFPTDPGTQTPVNTFSPSSTPVANSANGNTYVWNGTAWTTQQANLEQYVNVAGDTMTGPLTGTSATYSGIIAAANIPTQGSIVGYQQGIWTPTTNLGAAETIIHNSWSRIGNKVTIQAQLGSFNNSASSVIIVNGFPYPQSGDALGSVMTSKFDNGPDASHIGESSGLTFFKNGTSKNSNWTQLQYVNRLDANSTVWFSISYITDDTTWTPINGATVS
ncbi:hypothetical protein [Synechococcus phage MA10]